MIKPFMKNVVKKPRVHKVDLRSIVLRTEVACPSAANSHFKNQTFILYSNKLDTFVLFVTDKATAS